MRIHRLTFLILVVCCVLPAGGQTNTGPLAWYPFENPADPGHDAAGSLHAVEAVGVTSIEGPVGLAARFSAGFIQLPSAPELDLLSGDFTLSVLIRSDQVSNRNWLTKSSPGEHNYGLGAGHPGSIWGLGFRGLGRATSPIPVFDGDWHHAVGIKRGDRAELWLDGLRISEGPVGPLFGDEGAFAIGRNGLCCEWFDGEMDEVKIWNRALSTCEIRREARRLHSVGSCSAGCPE